MGPRTSVIRGLSWLILLAALAAGCAEEKTGRVPPSPPASPVPDLSPPPAPPALPSHGRSSQKRISPPVLAPQVTRDQELQLTQEAQASITSVEKAVADIDAAGLDADDRETLGTIQTFIMKAKAALSEKDFPRALNLAEKARVLAKDLPDGRH